MRARNVKPSFFKNELLATSDPLNAWVFEGLWCLADREGRLEDRPRRIHLEINPGRAYEGTEAALAWLTEQGFIVRYENGCDRYIQVVNFAKHQNPHPREVQSVIPPVANHGLGTPFDEHSLVEKHSQGTTKAQPRLDQTPHEGGGSWGQSPALSPSPLPDSPSLIPLKEREEARASARATRIPENFGLTPERRAVAETEKLDPERTFANFCDYWRAASGAKARKCDWDATWRVWCRNQHGNGGAPHKPAERRKTRYEEMQEALANATES